MSRFDYVKYDTMSLGKCTIVTERFKELEALIDSLVDGYSRPYHLAITALEEAHMWVGKAIKEAQLNRDLLTKKDDGDVARTE